MTGKPLSEEQEARFLELQAACARGEAPELRPGDVIYAETELYVGHGRDDFRGGLAVVKAFDTGGLAMRGGASVKLEAQPSAWFNWKVLAEKQARLAKEHGRAWAHAAPDDAPPSNLD